MLKHIIDRELTLELYACKLKFRHIFRKINSEKNIVNYKTINNKQEEKRLALVMFIKLSLHEIYVLSLSRSCLCALLVLIYLKI